MKKSNLRLYLIVIVGFFMILSASFITLNKISQEKLYDQQMKEIDICENYKKKAIAEEIFQIEQEDSFITEQIIKRECGNIIELN